MLALIHHDDRDSRFSEQFVTSKYYNCLLRDPIDYFFSILQRQSSTGLECIPVDSIKTHAIVFDFPHHLVATPAPSEYEHD